MNQGRCEIWSERGQVTNSALLCFNWDLNGSEVNLSEGQGEERERSLHQKSA